MFERQAADKATLVPAPAGFTLFCFVPPATLKPTMPNVEQLVRDSTFPVVAWRCKEGSPVEPVTLIEMPPGARYILQSGGKIFGIDDGKVFSTFEQFALHVLDLWKRNRPEPAAASPAVQRVTGLSIHIAGGGFG